MKILNLKKIVIGVLMTTLILAFGSIGASAEGNNYTKGWQNINNNWYYFSLEDGSIYSNGIDNINGKIYYFDTNGIMKTGWIYVNNPNTPYTGWHYFYDDGSMAKDTTIDGYILNDYGTCTNPDNSANTLQIQNKIIGKWSMKLNNGTTDTLLITNTTFNGYPYTVVKTEVNCIVIDINENNALARCMLKLDNNALSLYGISNNNFVEMAAGNKIS